MISIRIRIHPGFLHPDSAHPDMWNNPGTAVPDPDTLPRHGLHIRSPETRLWVVTRNTPDPDRCHPDHIPGPDG